MSSLTENMSNREVSETIGAWMLRLNQPAASWSFNGVPGGVDGRIVCDANRSQTSLQREMRGDVSIQRGLSTYLRCTVVSNLR